MQTASTSTITRRAACTAAHRHTMAVAYARTVSENNLCEGRTKPARTDGGGYRILYSRRLAGGRVTSPKRSTVARRRGPVAQWHSSGERRPDTRAPESPGIRQRARRERHDRESAHARLRESSSTTERASSGSAERANSSIQRELNHTWRGRALSQPTCTKTESSITQRASHPDHNADRHRH